MHLINQMEIYGGPALMATEICGGPAPMATEIYGGPAPIANRHPLSIYVHQTLLTNSMVHKSGTGLLM